MGLGLGFGFGFGFGFRVRVSDDGLGVGSRRHRLAAELLEQVVGTEARLGRLAISSHSQHQRALGLRQGDAGVGVGVLLARRLKS